MAVGIENRLHYNKHSFSEIKRISILFQLLYLAQEVRQSDQTGSFEISLRFQMMRDAKHQSRQKVHFQHLEA